MSISKIQTRIVLLQILCILVNMFIGHCEKMDVLMNVQLSHTGSYMQAYLLESNYELFRETFFNSQTHSVTLRYEFVKDGSNPTIKDIETEVYSDLDVFLYFRCSVHQENLSIICTRNANCMSDDVNYCPYGFGISWSCDGEFLLANSFENKTVNCVDEYNITCYQLVHSDYSTPLKLSSESMDTLLSTVTSTNGNLTSTMYLKDYSTQGAHSDSTAVIAGVTSGVVIAAVSVVIVLVICMKRKVMKESSSRGQTVVSSFEMTGRPIGDSKDGQQISHLDKDINNKSASRDVINVDEYAQYNNNINKYTNDIRNDTSVHYEPYSIPGSDSEGVDHSFEEPSKLVNSDTDIDVNYNTVNLNHDSLISTPVNQVGTHGNYSNDVNHSVVIEEHPATFPAEYATVDKNVSYKNFKEIEQNKKTAAEHEYNNLKKDYTTILRDEPAKNVYSKLRENIRHFEHTYGDDGRPLQAGEENSLTLVPDNTSFLLEMNKNMT